MEGQILSSAANSASGSVQGIIGAVQMYYGMKELKKLKKMGVPQFGLTSEVQNDINMANERAKRGFTPEQQAAAFQNANRQTNLSYQRGLANGGNTLAGSVSAASNANALAFLNNYYEKDASLMGANIRYAHQLNNEKLRIDQMNKQQQINIYNQDRQAASQLLNAGMYNTTSGIQAQLGAGAGAPTSGGNKISQSTKDMVSFKPNPYEQWNNGVGDLNSVNKNTQGMVAFNPNPYEQWDNGVGDLNF